MIAGLFLGMLLPLASSEAEAAPSSVQDYRMPLYFEETGFWVQGPFREYWETRGGLFIFGLPITGVFLDDGLYKQYFERAIFEWHPQNEDPYKVLLQRLGSIRTEGRQGEEPFQPLAPDTVGDENCSFFPETGHRLCFGFRGYWNGNGGLPNFGYPISEEFQEQNQLPPAGDGQTYTVQYFERARFEWHPEYQGTQYEVLLGLLGTEYLEANGAPVEALQRQDPAMPPNDPTSEVEYGPTVGYGFNAFLRGDEQPDRADFNQRTIDLTKNAGFNWLHFQAPWRSLEHSGPGLYDVAGLDRMVEAANSNGIKLLITVVGPTPEWMGLGVNIPTDETNLGHYRNLLQFLANRYAGRVQAWEIWNEQNLAQNMGGYVTVEPYVQLLKAGYEGVKAGDPNAVVVFGSLTPNGLDFPDIAIDEVLYLQRIFSYNGGEVKNYFDALGAHPGSNDNAPDQSWPNNPGTGGWDDHNSFYFRRIEDLRQVMLDNGQAHKQIWLTEFGWSTLNQAPGYEYGAAISEELQAQYLVRAFQIANWEWPWMGPMFVWNLNYSVITDPADEKYPWAVLNADWTPRPSYTALAEMPK